MGKLNKDNFRKTIHYLRKNGIKNTLYAVAERMQRSETDSYTYVAPDEQKLQTQRAYQWKKPVTFSIIVPLYHTPEKYFREMVESVLKQTYPYFQLILADSSGDNALECIVKTYQDSRICYEKLADNKGIAENTNAGIDLATGDYIALFDHDDLLTEDALYEMASRIKEEKERGIEPVMLYSDEDKCNSDASKFYDPHYKQDFNLDLLLTNNYICHLTVVKAELLKELKQRGEYNGAQDFDLVLRVAKKVYQTPERIAHVKKILYHWRCHDTSTAANPASKRYAYEAGKRAVEDFVQSMGWKAQVEHLKHLGFYRVNYSESILAQRPEVAAVGGKVLDSKNKISGGMMTKDGRVIFEGLPEGFSGYTNRAVLVQQAEALDIRSICLRKDCYALFEQVTGVSYRLLEGGKDGQLDWSVVPETERMSVSLKLSKTLYEAGYVLVWDPQW